MINQKKDFVDNRIPTLQLMAICMAAFLAPLIAGKLAFIPSFVIQLLILTAAILWLVDSKQRKQIILPGKFVAIPLVGFALLLLVSVIFSVNRGLSVSYTHLDVYKRQALNCQLISLKLLIYQNRF